jgi:hypothetical protein
MQSLTNRGLIATLFLSALILFISIPALTRAQSFRCFVLMPPEQLLDSVKTVAVADFDAGTRYMAESKPASGKQKSLDKILSTIEKVADDKKDQQLFTDSGKKLADLIIAGLLEEDRGVREVGSGFLGLGKKEGRSFQQGARTNVFTVVERARIDQVMEELKLSQTGLIDESQATQVGRMLGADAILTGNVSVSCDDKWVTETKTENKKQVQVKCNKRVANASATIRIVHVETGQLIGSKEASHKIELKKCDGDYGSALPTPEVTVDNCLQVVAGKLVDYFAPRFSEQKLEMAKVECGDCKRFIDAAEDAIDRYDLNTAYLQYAALAERDSYNHAVLYNIGVLHEAVGNYGRAQQQYAMASKLKSAEDRYAKAQTRVAKQIDFWDKLGSLGLTIEEYDFNVSAEKMQSATAKKILINGKSSDRYEVKAAADLSSQTLVRVPGGIELEVIDSGGEWYKIRLLDGRDGYFLKRDAKFIK